MKIFFTFALLLIMAGNLLPQSYNSDGYTGKIHPNNPSGIILYSDVSGNSVFTVSYNRKVDVNNFLLFAFSSDKGSSWKYKSQYVSTFDLNKSNWTKGDNGDYWFTGINNGNIQYGATFFNKKLLYKFNTNNMLLDSFQLGDSLSFAKFHYFGNGKGIVDAIKILKGGIRESYELRLYKTSNNGKSWEVIVPQIAQSYANNYSFMHFPDSLNGYFVVNFYHDYIYGPNHHLLKTTDGGNTWRVIRDGTDYILQLEFSDKNNGYRTLALFDITILQCTTDGGNNWFSTLVITNSYYYKPLLKIEKVINYDSLYITLNNKLYSCNNRGKNRNLIVDQASIILGTSFTNYKEFAINYSPWDIRYTTNAGVSFSSFRMNKFNGDIIKIKMFSVDTIYVITSNGIPWLIKSYDGGISFDTISIPDVVTQNSSSLYPLKDHPHINNINADIITKNDIVINGLSVSVKTSDGGKTWKKIYTFPVYDNSSNWFKFRVVFKDSLNGFIWERRNLVSGNAVALNETNDGGSSWKEKLIFIRPRSENTYNPYSFISFPTKNIGYMATGYGPILKSTDGGSNWFELDTANFNVTWRYCFYDYVYAPDSNNVYASGFFSNALLPQIRKSTDGGLTWHLSRRGYDPDLLRITSSKTIVGQDFNLFNLKYNYGDSIWYTQMNVGYITSFDLKDSLLVYGGMDGALYKRYVPKKRMVVDVNEENFILPDNFSLEQNYPNPFNPHTVIRYNIKESGIVEIKTYNFLGEEINVLVNREHSPGIYEIVFDGSKLSSGIYFYRITAKGFADTKKMILIK